MAIRKASRQYNSDYMSRLCDDELEQLEERLTALYANATNDVLYDYDKWMSHYKANYNEMCAKLEADEITKKEFQEWVDRRMFDNKLFTKTIESMTDVLVNTDIVAMALLNDELPLIIAQSYNFVQSLGFAAADEAGLSVGTFQIYNAKTVQSLIKDNPDILKYVNKEKDYTFNKERINNEITHSILNGDSIQKTANRLQNVSSMDENSAIRAARTAMTAAENLGRNEGFHDLKEKGIPSRLQWSATHDSRTRDTHILLDGQYQDEDGYFRVEGYEIQFPGDPAAEPEMIYNCRCRASLRLNGVDHSQDGDLYEKFMKENYPDDWNAIKDGIKEKEAAYKEKASGARERVQEMIPASEKKEDANVISEEQTETGIVSDNLPASTIEVIGEKGEPISPEILAETVNPHYLEAGYTENCQRCVVGYELGRRGYDVEAMAFDGSYLTTQSVFDISTQFKSGENFGTYITGEKYNPRFAQDKYPFNQSPKTTANSIVRAMTDWGDGSRATLEVSWRSGGGAHVVNVENIGGVVKIIDAQSGMIFDNIEGYLSRTKCAETELRRTDILEIRDNIPQEIMERICRKRE